MKPQYLTRQESGAVRGHLKRALAAIQLVRQSLHPIHQGGRIDVAESIERVRALHLETTQLLCWLNAIKKGTDDGTDLTAHL